MTLTDNFVWEQLVEHSNFSIMVYLFVSLEITFPLILLVTLITKEIIKDFVMNNSDMTLKMSLILSSILTFAFMFCFIVSLKEELDRARLLGNFLKSKKTLLGNFLQSKNNTFLVTDNRKPETNRNDTPLYI